MNCALFIFHFVFVIISCSKESCFGSLALFRSHIGISDFNSCNADETLHNKFPKNFRFGIATSSYQIEGAWNISGKSESIWDRFTHTRPEKIIDGSNADIACDSYHKLNEDVKLLKDLGVHVYRFSLSWTRILPSFLSNKINPGGIRYYNELINLLLENGIEPMVTIFHWDLPQFLQNLGGFSNSLVIEHLVNYARIVFELFGDRVKLWTTINEAYVFCLFGYGQDIIAPASNLAGIAEYLCAHNVIKSHAAIYHLYNNTFKTKQKGRVSINLSGSWYEPASQDIRDQQASERALQFDLGLYAHPIFSKSGDYPDVVKKNIAKRSKAEGFSQSRLPKFTQEEVNYIKGTYDMFCINHYSTSMAAYKEPDPIDEPSYVKDMNVNAYHDPSWPVTASPYNKVVPWGFTNILVWIKKEYGDIEIFVTESGVADTGEINDVSRINYFKLYLQAVLDAIYIDGVRVTQYIAWSLIDNFEWMSGYSQKFGLYHVDFSSPNRTRTSKASVAYYKQVIASGNL